MPVVWNPLPYGLSHLEANAFSRYQHRDPSLVNGDQIRCCISNCTQWMPKRRRGKLSDEYYCPIHQISVSTSPTYVYRDRPRNFIVDCELVDQVGKVESSRLGNESSEDALSWNVFVGLSRLNALSSAFKVLTGMDAVSVPELYLWGHRVDGTSISEWDRLGEVRRTLERGLGIPTEPDIMMRVPGQAIVLVEAKFGSGNGTLQRKEARFGSVQEFLRRYYSRPGSLDPLDRQWIAGQQPRAVLEQICRNVVFAHWLAEDEQPFVINLIRQTQTKGIIEQFSRHLAPGSCVTFRIATWEQLAHLPATRTVEGQPLSRYLSNKSLRLRKAFCEGADD